jgi:mRNA interferase RelE/StbE
VYEVVLNKNAVVSLGKSTPQIRHRIFAALDKVKTNPLSGKRLHGELDGLFSLRIGEMRIIYEIDSNQKIIVVHAIGPRGDVYKK